MHRALWSPSLSRCKSGGAKRFPLLARNLFLLPESVEWLATMMRAAHMTCWNGVARNVRKFSIAKRPLEHTGPMSVKTRQMRGPGSTTHSELRLDATAATRNQKALPFDFVLGFQRRQNPDLHPSRCQVPPPGPFVRQTEVPQRQLHLISR